MARVEYMQPETVAAMAATGCRYVGMGIECGDETFRREHLNRRMSNTSIEAAFDLVKKAGIFVTSFNMIGYPFPNDPALTEATLRLNERIRPDFAQISIFYPFPGTELYRHCVENDLIDTERMAQAREYFSESVLKGVSLAATKRRLETRLNPHGLRFSMKGPQVAQGDSQGRADAETPPAPLPAGPKTARVLMLSPDHLMIDRRILQEARSLAREGLTVNVVSGLECPKEEHYEEGGVSVHRYSFRGAAGRSSRAARAIAQAVPQWGPLAHLAARLERWAVPRSAAGRFARQCAEQFPADVVHVHDLPLLWLGARLAKQWNAALVYDAHEIYWVHGSFSPAMQKALAREERAYAGRIDLFITVNQAIADYFEGLYHQRPLVLMNCAESPPPGDRAEIRRRLRAAAGIPGDSKVVLYQGWFSPERNLATLVRAAERLPQGAYLLMIGYGDYEKELRAIAVAARSGDKVRFLGRIEADDLLAFTAGADLGVIPYQPVDLNHRLCSPNKFFEYVQSGVPVVAQDLPFFHQMQQDHGVVSVGDLSTIEGMAGAINSLLADEPRLEAMRLACRRAAETINWETEARKLVEAYRAMLDRRRG
jgi:glycosyltransferase involved in cell wall biosynthesis